jgi:hypothetical protein
MVYEWGAKVTKGVGEFCPGGVCRDLIRADLEAGIIVDTSCGVPCGLIVDDAPWDFITGRT